MKKNTRLRLRQRRNYLPTVLSAIFFWLLWGGLVWLVDPEVLVNLPPKKSYWPFFMLLFVSLFLTLALIFSNSRRGFLVSNGVVLFLILRLVGLGHMINGLLIGGILVAVEIYFSSKD